VAGLVKAWVIFINDVVVCVESAVGEGRCTSSDRWAIVNIVAAIDCVYAGVDFRQETKPTLQGGVP
jgi:hypothetical protein